MTEGSPAKLLITFALPLMVGNVFQQLYTVVDTAVVGQVVGVSALAALGAADWLNWMVPDTDCNLPIFASGWGDGYYPVYFGYDAKGEICAVYVRFIDIETSYREQA